VDKKDVEKYIIYGAKWCNYCNMAASLIKSNGIQFYYMDLTEDNEYKEDVKRFYNVRTIPLILAISHSGITKRIGGYTELREFLG